MSTSIWAALAAPPPVLQGRSGSAYRMYRSILGAHACILVSLALFTVLPWLEMLGSASASVLVPRVVIVVVLLGVAFSVFRSGETWMQLWVLCATFLVVAPLIGTAVERDDTVAMTLSACTIMAARLFPMIYAMGLAGALSCIHVATLAVLDLPPTNLDLDALLISFGLTFAAVSMVNAMQVTAIEAEHRSQINRDREVEVVRRADELRATRVIRRVLHDDVLGTLHLIADAVTDPDSVKGQCQRTIEAIRRVVQPWEREEHPRDDHQPDAPHELPPAYCRLVSDVQAGAPVPVHTEVVGLARRLPELSDVQAHALARAATEGVRNAVRHGGAERALLRITGDRRVLRIEVSDQGRGLVEGHRAGFGLTESVVRPLAEFGGSAMLHDRPGGGAVLSIALPRSPSAEGFLSDAHGLTTDGLGPIVRLSRAVAIPLSITWTLLAIHTVIRVPSTWPSLLLVVAWIAATALIIRRWEAGSPRPAEVVAMALILLVIQVLGIAWLPPGGMLDFRSWSIGMSALPLVVFLLNLPVRVGVLVVLSHIAVIVGATLVKPALSSGMVAWGSLNSVVTAPVPSMVLGSLIRRQAPASREERQREVVLTDRRDLEDLQTELADLYFAHVRHEVLPWLDALASGARDPQEPSIKTEARLLAVAARDDLYAPGFFDDSLRADVAHFRSRGGAVELRAGLVPGGFERPVGKVLRGLLPVSAGRRIIVSPAVAPEQRVRISVVPAPHQGDLERLLTLSEQAFESDVDNYRAVLLVADLPVSG